MPTPPALDVLLLVAKASALLGVAALVAFAVRHRAAARRHAVWTAAFAGLLALPLVVPLAPAWHAGWLARPTASVAAPTGGDASADPAAAPALLPALPGTSRVADPSPAAPLAPAQVLLLVYALGVAGVVVYGGLGALQLRRWRRASLPDADLTRTARALAASLGVRRAVDVRLAPGLPTPMTWGVRRPLVLLPADAAGWTDERRRVVFLHELAHVARLDALTQTLAFAGCALLWFHPLAWAGAHAMRTARERACDDLVLASGTRASAYAAHLVALARTLRPRAVPAFAAAVVRQSELETRVRAILAPDVRRGRVGPRAAAFAAAGLAGVVLPLAAFQPWTAPRTAPAATPSAAPSTNGARTAFAAASPAQTDPLRARYAVRMGGTLTLDADAGSVRVLVGDGNTVDVTVERTFDVRLDGRSSGADASVRIRRADPQRRWQRGDRVETTVRVPARYSVHVATAGGSLTVARLDGSVDAQTAGGAVSVAGATGDVRAATSGGSVTVGRVDGRLAVRTSGGSVTLDGGAAGAVTAETAGGSITATLRHRLAAGLELSTSGGSIALTLPAGTNAALDAEAMGGAVSSAFGGARGPRLRTRIGSGGPTVRLRTLGGSISIRRSESALAAPAGSRARPEPPRDVLSGDVLASIPVPATPEEAPQSDEQTSTGPSAPPADAPLAVLNAARPAVVPLTPAEVATTPAPRPSLRAAASAPAPPVRPSDAAPLASAPANALPARAEAALPAASAPALPPRLRETLSADSSAAPLAAPRTTTVPVLNDLTGS